MLCVSSEAGAKPIIISAIPEFTQRDNLFKHVRGIPSRIDDRVQVYFPKLTLVRSFYIKRLIVNPEYQLANFSLQVRCFSTELDQVDFELNFQGSGVGSLSVCLGDSYNRSKNITCRRTKEYLEFITDDYRLMTAVDLLPNHESINSETSTFYESGYVMDLRLLANRQPITDFGLEMLIS
jgi:hypothetical protein